MRQLIDENEIINVYNLAMNGKSQSFVAKLYGVSNSCIQRFAVKYKIVFQHRKNFNIKKCTENFFDTIDNEEKSYILGFLIADGCLKKEKRKNNFSYRIAFNNSIDDIDIIQKIHSLLCPNNNLIIRDNKCNEVNRKKQVLLQFTSKKLFDVLYNTYNIKPNKTFDNNFIFPIKLIPNELRRHFIRGFFDGDGSFTNKKDLRFVFNSPYFMKQICLILKEEFKKRNTEFSYKMYTVNGKNVDYWRLIINVGKKRLNCLYDILYNKTNIYLKRKKEKIEYEYKKI